MHEGFAGNLQIVEGDDTLARLLVLLVPLAGDQDDVTGLGLVNSQLDGLVAVRLKRVANASALKPQQSVVHDGDGIFATRIIAGEDDEVAAIAGRFSHERTLGTIAVPTASEDSNNSSGTAALVEEIVRHCSEVPNRVVGVGVVNNHGEWLAEVQTLEASGDVCNLIGSFGDGVGLDITRRGGCRRGGARTGL